MTQKVWFITGASRGFGALVAREPSQTATPSSPPPAIPKR